MRLFADLLARHDMPLVAFAIAICVAGAIAMMRMFVRATQAQGSMRFAWVFLCAIVMGSATWSTHFVAMLAFDPGMPAHYEPVLTIVSLLLAIVGMNLGLVVAARSSGGTMPAVGGGILGLAVAGMHYAGMAAYVLDGHERWRTGLVGASIALGIVLAGLAMMAFHGQLGREKGRFAAQFLIGSIVSIHFIGMAALDPGRAMPGAHAMHHGSMALAFATGAMGLLVIAAGVFVHFIDLHARQDAAQWIDRMGLTDALTGLPNQSALDIELAARIGHLPSGAGLQLLTIKPTNFADVIERHGQCVSDLVIRATAERIKQACEGGFYLARTGKSEFTAIGPAATDYDIRERADAIVALLAKPVLVNMTELIHEPRIGVARFPDDATTAEELIRCSRLALNCAKADLFAPVCVYEGSSDLALLRRQILTEDLRGAVQSSELELYYQPQVWIETRRVMGYEALLRWRHPRFGMVSPAEFIPLAEASGGIVAIGEWVLRTACMTAAQWPAEWSLAVNVSPLQLRQADLPRCIHEALLQSGLTPRRLEIELTESLLLDDRDRALHVLRGIRALGVRLALDDFGTGYSSLDVLRHFPFDKIKLDRSFVRDIETNPQSIAILQAVLAMGRSLKIPVLVEGVETERQLAILLGEGCRKIQGFLTGRPLPAEAIGLDPIDEIEVLRKAG